MKRHTCTNCTRSNQNTTCKTFIFFLFSFHSAKYTSVKDSYFSFFPPLNDGYDPCSLPLNCNEFLSTWMCVTVQNRENRSFCLWLAKMPPRLLCPRLIAAVRLRLNITTERASENAQSACKRATKRNVGSATISILIFSKNDQDT